MSIVIAKFATTMRADSLVQELHEAGIVAQFERPRWTNKKLPPPNVEVSVAETDVIRSADIVAKFKGTK